jgi:general secretion pathway protein G
VKRESGITSLLPVSPSPRLPAPLSSARGWTLIELVITITVLAVLTIGVIPLVQNSVRRQKEQRLREVLREMRTAIDTFKRDTYGMQCTAGGAIIPGGGTGGGTGVPQQPGQVVWNDPRSTVVVADCKLFGVDNPDRYPPDLQTLVDGVDVVPRFQPGAQPGVGLGNDNRQASDNPGLVPKKKVYLREIPVDPITGNNEWCLRSSYDTPDDGCSSAPENVFDVRSKSEATALNGEKYSDW